MLIRIHSLLSLKILNSITKKIVRAGLIRVDQAVGSSLEHTHEGVLKSMLVTNASSSMGNTNPLLQ